MFNKHVNLINNSYFGCLFDHVFKNIASLCPCQEGEQLFCRVQACDNYHYFHCHTPLEIKIHLVAYFRQGNNTNSAVTLRGIQQGSGNMQGLTRTANM